MPIQLICNGCSGRFPKLTRGRCTECRQKLRTKLGMDAKWAATSKQYRTLYPNCDTFESNTDCTKLATTVDHIHGRAAGDGYENLRGLCHSCHGKVEAAKQG